MPSIHAIQVLERTILSDSLFLSISIDGYGYDFRLVCSQAYKRTHHIHCELVLSDDPLEGQPQTGNDEDNTGKPSSGTFDPRDLLKHTIQ